MNMRIDNVIRKSQILFDDKWCQLRRVIDDKIQGYTFLHEIRCDGEIISILPYRIVDDDIEFLLRKEATPCWELANPVLSSITGGIDSGSTPQKTAVKELEEETGYCVYQSDLIHLGKCYGTKSVSTTYHLFSVNLTGKEQTAPLYVETELEESSTCEWVKYEELLTVKDPFVYVCYAKLMNHLFTE